MIRPCCERCGSSPLTRGKRCRYPGGRGHGGLIPAHAGKTIFQALLTRTTGAHPRSRGENAHPQATAVGEGGSSPLTRGKPLPSTRQLWSPGLIPAHAGKTIAVNASTVVAGAHPRSRGENVILRAMMRPPSGSSPLTRGKPLAISNEVAVGGLIPAHAGKTRPGASTATSYAAHPRSRGENVFFEALCQIQCGSSPLTRGKPAAANDASAPVGLIPAHAGKTNSKRSAISELGAHPRSRGENRAAISRTSPASGSSPLTRGKRCGRRPSAAPSRLIPAHAGKTPRR